MWLRFARSDAVSREGGAELLFERAFLLLEVMPHSYCTFRLCDACLAALEV